VIKVNVSNGAHSRLVDPFPYEMMLMHYFQVDVSYSVTQELTVQVLKWYR